MMLCVCNKKHCCKKCQNKGSNTINSAATHLLLLCPIIFFKHSSLQNVHPTLL